MNLVYLAITAFGVSAVGSIPVGIINLNIMSTAIKQGLKPAVYMVLGAVIVEFFQIWIAITCVHIFLENALYKNIFSWITIFIFLTVSLFYFFKKSEPKRELSEQEDKNGIRHPIFKGMLVSSLNVMAFPYWAFFSVWLGQQNWLDFSQQSIILISASAMIGAFITLYGYARWGKWLDNKWDWVYQKVNRILAIVFLILAIISLILNLNQG